MRMPHNKKLLEKFRKSFGKIKTEYFNFDLIRKYHEGKDHSMAYHQISDKTCNDLNFDELFMFLDRTTSRIGQQYLYSRLRVIREKSIHPENEEFLAFINKNENLRLSIQAQLAKLSHKDAYYISSLFQEKHMQAPGWFWIIPVMSMLGLILLILTIINPVFILGLIGVFAINMGFHYWNKRNIFQFLVSIPQLLKLNRVASQLKKEDQLKNLVSPSLHNSIKVLDQLKLRMSVFNLDSRLGDDFSSIIFVLLELIKTLILLEPLLLFNVLKKLDTKRNVLQEVFEFVGKVDLLISIASLRKGLDHYCIPEFHKECSIESQYLYHPLIVDCIGNELVVTDKSILLTGSNMSGKTTFIRTIGINAITAMTINTCFAEHFTLPWLKIYSAIRLSDDLLNDKSYYFEEVLTIKEMLDSRNDPEVNLFLLDEIYKGTNTIERIAAGKAVLSELAKSSNIVFVSTHDIELADLLQDEYELYHFSENVDQKSIDFDYTLKHGRLKDGNAIKILQLNQYPETLVTEAFKIARKLRE